MSCSCGSTRCICVHGCYCHQAICMCKKCLHLEKLCSRCNLPFYVNTSREGIEREVCCCQDQEFTFYTDDQSNRRTSAVAKGNQLSEASGRRDICSECDLPVLFAATAEDYDRSDQYCCCSNRSFTTHYPDVLTERETSNSTLDPREVSADRHGRKAQSRKTRTKMYNWQAKKVKERSSNAAEDCSNTEIIETEYPRETSSSGSSMDNDEQNTSLLSPFGDISTAQNFNRDSNTQSPAGNTSKADESSKGNISLLVNTSGAPSPSASNSFSRGFFQSHENLRPNLPRPFPRFPNPITGTPAFSKQLGRLTHLQFKKWTSSNEQRFPDQKSSVIRSAKLEKWFGTLEPVIIRFGRLPDAAAAAALDEEDRQRGMEERVLPDAAAAAALDEEDRQRGMEERILPDAAAAAASDEEDRQRGMEERVLPDAAPAADLDEEDKQQDKSED